MVGAIFACARYGDTYIANGWGDNRELVGSSNPPVVFMFDVSLSSLRRIGPVMRFLGILLPLSLWQSRW